MQIHVVQAGQTLYGIAGAYGVTVDELVQANALMGLPHLVVGQALVIPISGRYYWVRPGESLWSISRQVGLSPEEIARINQISPAAPLQVGLRLYIPPGPRPATEVNAYAEPTGDAVSPALEADVRQAAPLLTYLAPFSYRIQRDGSLEPPPLGQLPEVARANGTALMLVVTNLEEGQFSAELGRLVLNDEALQETLLNNVVQTAQQGGFSDVHFDMEFLRPEDREAYTRFLRRAAERVHGAGLMISAALAPKTSAAQVGAWYEAHDYAAIGQIVDFVVIMTYEWGYSGGPPMAVSPIGPVRQVLEYAIREMDPAKILMGQNLYGYDWTLPYVPGGPLARALSPRAAVELAAQRNAAIAYDYSAQAPHFQYSDEQGRTHVVWFEDARSIQAKFNLMKELGVRGISYWRLGLSFPQNWLLLGDNFTVVKHAAATD